MSENKQQNGARNLKTIAPLCSLCPSRLSTSLNVSQRVQVVQKGTSQAQRVGWGSCIGWSSLGIFDKLDRPYPGNDLMDSQFLATISAHILDIVHVLYINYIYKPYIYIYILANIFQYSVVPIVSLHLRIQPGFNIAGCGRQIEGHPAMSRCCMMSYAYCIYIYNIYSIFYTCILYTCIWYMICIYILYILYRYITIIYIIIIITLW